MTTAPSPERQPSAADADHRSLDSDAVNWVLAASEDFTPSLSVGAARSASSTASHDSR